MTRCVKRPSKQRLAGLIARVCTTEEPSGEFSITRLLQSES